jgi:hypothetical protein
MRPTALGHPSTRPPPLPEPPSLTMNTLQGLTVALLALLTAQDGGQSAESVIQKDTKVAFPVVRHAVPTDAPDAPETPVHHLAGTALRDKTIFGVDVYAYGIYLEPRAAQRILARWKGTDAAKLAKDEEFYAALYSGEPLAKTLRMVFVRNVDGEDVAEAFEEGLAPRIARAAKEPYSLPDATEELARFKGYFSLDKLKKGNEVVISVDEAGRLTTEVAGEIKPPIQSPALAWAMFDVFLGDDPIEERGKREVVGRVPELLATDLGGDSGN